MIKVFYDQFNGTMKFKKQRFKLHTGLIGLLLIFVLADANPRPTRSSVMFEDCGKKLQIISFQLSITVLIYYFFITITTRFLYRHIIKIIIKKTRA